MWPYALQTRTSDISYHRSLYSRCYWNGGSGQDNDQYLGCVPSVLDAVLTRNGSLLRWRGCPQQRHCQSNPSGKGH
eukprot:7686040-Pyramimonas_sp.AAC.1